MMAAILAVIGMHAVDTDDERGHAAPPADCFAGLLAETVVLLALLIGVPALVLLLGWQS